MKIGMKLGWIRWQQSLQQILRPIVTRLLTIVSIGCLVLMTLSQPAWAGLTDDNFDGEIFALYAGNGSIVPPKNDLDTTIKQGKAAVMVFYVDDSRDCKEFSIKVSNLQGLYSKVTNFIPIRVDSIAAKDSYDKSEPGYYYKGYVPQTVIFDPQGNVKFDEGGQASFESMDDVMRSIFDLLPREESTALQRRPLNEVSGELN
jgi:hypothetical protein